MLVMDPEEEHAHEFHFGNEGVLAEDRKPDLACLLFFKSIELGPHPSPPIPHRPWSPTLHRKE